MDEARYGELLKEIRPRIIESPAEHERLLSAAETLMEKGDALSTEEREALALIVLLIEAFESQVMRQDDEDEELDEAETPAPYITLQRLMQSSGVELSDLVSIFGNPVAAQEAMEGRRSITRGQARELGRLFRVPDKLFRDE